MVKSKFDKMSSIGLILTCVTITVVSAIDGNQLESVANVSDTKHSIILKPSHPPCKWSEQYLDVAMQTPSCRLCSVCKQDEHEISACTKTADRICRRCPKGQVMSERDRFCQPCGCCSGEPYDHQVQPDCLAAGLPINEACMADEPCPDISTLASTVLPSNKTEENKNETAAVTTQEDKNSKTDFVVIGVLACVLLAVLLGVVLYIRISKKCKRKPLQIPAVIYKRHIVDFPVEETRPHVRAERAVGEPTGPNPDMPYYDATQPFLSR